MITLKNNQEIMTAKHEEEIKKWQLVVAESNTQLLKITEELEKMKITDLGNLKEQDQARFKQIFELCKNLPPLPNMEGIHVGFFGCTGVGKSTLINTLLGEKVCAVGLNQTTLEATPYRKKNSVVAFWDIPGQTDKISYLTTTYIGLLKAMSFIGIVVWRTCHEISRIIELLEYIGMTGKYSIIVTKQDTRARELADNEENVENGLQEFKRIFEKEVAATESVRPKSIYYICSKNSASYDFPKFLNDLPYK